MEILASIKEKIGAIKKQKEELVAQLRNDFAPMLKPLFEKLSGKIKSIGWTQYTPYFNDGDECIFGVNADLDSMILNGSRVDETAVLNRGTYGKVTAENIEEHKKFNAGKYGYKWYVEKKIGDDGYHLNKEFDKELYDVMKEISDVINSFEGEFLKDLFGDHVEVTINSDGTTSTEEHEHD